MARLKNVGFELNSTTLNVELNGVTGSPTIVTSPVRSGTYAFAIGKVNPLVSGDGQNCMINFAAATGNGPYFIRFYMYIETAPTADNVIFKTNASIVNIKLTSSRTLLLRDEDGQIGSASSVLNLNQWYRVEILMDRTGIAGAHIVTGLLEGDLWASSSTRDLSVGINNLFVCGNGFNEAQTQGIWYFDDVAINDSTGSFQNTYPGSGKIIHLKPNAAGDANGFLTQVGGTAGSTNNFTRVNEVTPNDATSYNASALLNAEDLFNCDDSGIGLTDTVNVVAVGVRMADLVATDATAGFKLEIEKTGSGTKAQSANIVPNSTSFITNDSASPKNYPLVTYQDPDSAVWTKTTLDSMQIGYIIDVVNVQSVAISTVWASVDYTPADINIPLYTKSISQPINYDSAMGI